jgi:hypothetical protein
MEVARRTDGEKEVMAGVRGDGRGWAAECQRGKICGSDVIVWLAVLTAERRRQGRRTPKVLGALVSRPGSLSSDAIGTSGRIALFAPQPRWINLRGDFWARQEMGAANGTARSEAGGLWCVRRLWEGVAGARIASLDVRRRTQVFEYERLALAWRLHFPD